MTSEDGQNLDALERRQLDSDDLNKELAGKQFSRRVRFLTSEDDESNPRERRKSRDFERQARISALAQMMTDPAYRALYEQTSAKLYDAQTATDQALDRAEADLIGAQAALDDLKDKANQLSDGTRVYRDTDGNVRREDGSLVTGLERDEIVWKDGAPTFEEFLAQQQALKDARISYEDLLDLQVILGGYRDRLDDPDNPLSADQLEAIQNWAEKTTAATLHNEMAPERAATHTAEGSISAGYELPSLG